MFNLELDKVIEEIQKRKPEQVLIQLPDGLKHRAAEIVDTIEDKTDVQIFILFGGTFGACDLPLGLNVLNIDLMIQWGHNRFHKEEW
ncbi:diphthamide synthesis protein [Candidatus Pacearchaeota archaeon]|nr:diphthamide synthesis protein [Candidatus Pacearchaeota archaeon]